jgi:aspartate beta-hydroxylase
MYDRTASFIRQIYDRRISTPAVLDLDSNFPDWARFADNWEAIRDEALLVGQRLAQVPRFHEIMREQTDISANDGRDWRMFILKAYGVDVPRNRARCATLSALLDECDDVVSCALSFLAPGKHIPRHRGPFRGVLRFHLGLAMPRAADSSLGTLLDVDGEEHRLDDGDCLLWDDTYPHEVWNRTDEVRIALLLDVWRSDMPLDMRMLSHLVAAAVRLGIRVTGALTMETS